MPFSQCHQTPKPEKIQGQQNKEKQAKKVFFKIYNITFSSSKSSVMLNHPKTVKCMLYPLLNLKNTYTPCTFSFISKK